jgi:hypothetical protein
VGYTGTDGTPSLVIDETSIGDAVNVSRTFVVGTHDLLANGMRCGAFQIESNRETDVVLSLQAGGCSISTDRVHGPEATHPDPAASTGSIIGTAPPHSTVTLLGTDVASAARHVSADESGAFRFDLLPAGRYRISVDGGTGPSRFVQVVPGDVARVSFPAATEP